MENIRAAPAAHRASVRPKVSYSRTRVSYSTIGLAAVSAAAVTLVTRSVWDTDWSASPPPVIGVPIVVLSAILAVGAVFSCFTVEVRDGTLAWWFGFGAFRHEVRLSSIAQANPASASWFEVHDIVWGRRARAYGASGGDAVELKLYDGSSLKLQAREPEALLMVLGDWA
jgi:hypothetical protein